jgi:hypothetical protein
MELTMRKLLLATCLSVISVPAMATCEALQEQIVAKLQAKGIQSYTLEIQPVKAAAKSTAASGVPAASGVAAAQPAGKVVGTCDNGTKQIIYNRK